MKIHTLMKIMKQTTKKTENLKTFEFKEKDSPSKTFNKTL